MTPSRLISHQIISSSTVRHVFSTQNLWQLVFEWRNSIWSAVLPYCILNCLIMVVIELLAMWDIKIAFSPSGHGLMTLIVSFLVINKVNLAYDRYMQSRHAIGHALSSLRELNQSALLYTEALAVSGQHSSSLASDWRLQVSVIRNIFNTLCVALNKVSRRLVAIFIPLLEDCDKNS